MSSSKPTPAWQAARERRMKRRRDKVPTRPEDRTDDLALLDSQVARLMRARSYTRPLPPVPPLHQLARRRAERNAA
jgi:hypothetical protein